VVLAERPIVRRTVAMSTRNSLVMPTVVPAGGAMPVKAMATASRRSVALAARPTRYVDDTPGLPSWVVNARPTSTAVVPVPRAARAIISRRIASVRTSPMLGALKTPPATWARLSSITTPPRIAVPVMRRAMPQAGSKPICVGAPGMPS
jgi:hypothetical protein